MSCSRSSAFVVVTVVVLPTFVRLPDQSSAATNTRMHHELRGAGIIFQQHAPRGELCIHVKTFHTSAGAETGTLQIGVVGVRGADSFY